MWLVTLREPPPEQLPVDALPPRTVAHLCWLRWMVETRRIIPALDGLASPGLRRRRLP